MRCAVCVLLFVISHDLDGERLSVTTPSSPNQAALTARGAFFALSVADVQKAAAWYRETLGLDVIMSSAATPTLPAVTILEGQGLIVELIQNASPSAPRLSSNGSEGPPRLFKAGVIVQDFDATIAHLKSRGVPFVAGPFPPRPKTRANALIRDVDGNLIQFFGNAQ